MGHFLIVSTENSFQASDLKFQWILQEIQWHRFIYQKDSFNVDLTNRKYTGISVLMIGGPF